MKIYVIIIDQLLNKIIAILNGAIFYISKPYDDSIFT